jgi:thioredoxin:protein disulfide reductase
MIRAPHAGPAQPQARAANRSLLTGLLALLVLATVGGAAVAQQVLHPEVAFPYTVETDGQRLVVTFDIRDGYYLYRDKFGFESLTSGARLSAPRMPAGRIHTDEFFGEQEIYRGRFSIEIPYSRSRELHELTLQTTLQGCADIGLCYPPQYWNRDVALPPGPITGGTMSQPVMLGELLTGERSRSAMDDILPPEQAFAMNAIVDGPNQLLVSWNIEPGYYLYRDSFEFRTESDIRLGAPALPPGVEHHDEFFGDVTVYYDHVEVTVPFARASPDEMPLEITAVFQGCKDESICYPPIEQAMAMTLPASSVFASTLPAAAPVTEQDRLAALLLADQWWLVLGTFFGLGLLLAFTPCVLPMVPILSGIIAGHNQVSTGRAFALSLTFVLGMAVTYTAAGALAAIAGGQIQAIFQKPWIIGLFSALFVAMGLAMFGLIRVQMPVAIQTRLAGLANRQSAGTFAGTAAIGALSALIVTTCVAPPLVAALAVIGQTGDVVRGSSALFALSLGMGAPLLAFGTSAGRLLPKVGPWMNVVKAAFGVMLIGLAIWMLERILPGAVTLFMWGVLVVLTGVFMGAFDPLPAQPPATRRLGKGLGLVACLYGALMLVGAALGGNDPLRPIPQAALTGVGEAPAQRLSFRTVTSVAQLETELAAARQAGRPVMVDFTADWCVSCKEMERYTFTADAVVNSLEPFVLLKIDVTANTPDDRELLQYFSSFGPPTIAFFDARGNRLDGFTLVGFVRANDFATHVNTVAAI